MISLFNINNYCIDTSKYNNILHGNIVKNLEIQIANYVGAKYAVSFNSATSAIFLALLDKKQTVYLPSIIPPVVANAIITSDNKYEFVDNIDWVGDSYILHDFGTYKIVDSAQKIEKNQFTKECKPNDLMIFSFYPTKPIGGCDGGIIVSDDLEKIEHLREMSLNGMSYSENNWDRKIKHIGYKMYMNSIQAEIVINNFNCYENKLKKLEEIRLRYNKSFNKNNTSSHLYRINVKNRELFIQRMKLDGIMTGVHYMALHLNKIYSKKQIKLPLSEIESETTVSIPFHENMKEEEIDHVIKSVIKNNTFD